MHAPRNSQQDSEVIDNHYTKFAHLTIFGLFFVLFFGIVEGQLDDMDK